MFKRLLSIQLLLLFSISSAYSLGYMPPRTVPTPVAEVQDEEVIKKIDKIEVYKYERKLKLLVKKDGDYDVYKTYPIMLGFSPIGHKVQEGDGKTPEGKYTIGYKNPKSKYHLSLHVSYPNKADREYAESLGVSPGGDIMVHGMPNDAAAWGRSLGLSVVEEIIYQILYLQDWTQGCIAVSNEAIREIYELTESKTPIEIFP
jgi:murein L,D-transpeptidase YafK